RGPEASQLAAKWEQARRRAAAGGERVGGTPRPVAEDAGFDADEQQEQTDTEHDERDRPVARCEQGNRRDDRRDSKSESECRRRYAVVAALPVRDGDRHRTCLVGRELLHLRLGIAYGLAALGAVARLFRQPPATLRPR